MKQNEIMMYRSMLLSECARQTFDAFILPVNELGLTPEEERNYGRAAVRAVANIDWETYRTTRATFLDQAEKLLKVRPLTEKEKTDLKVRMFTRFMEGRINSFIWQEKQEHAKLPPIEVGKNDFHNTEMASVFAHLPFQPDVAKWLRKIDVDWRYDRLHMVSWFSGQLSLGSGKYSRSRPNHSAKVTYGRLLNPHSLLWIAAALGVEKETVIRAGHEIKDYETWRVKCGVIRRAIPWQRIYELALPLVDKEKEQRT